MSRYGKRPGRGGAPHGKPETDADAGPDSPLKAQFRQLAAQLTERQDRHERLVKISRDINIESKRIIFLLHSASRGDSEARVVEEAGERMARLHAGLLRAGARELRAAPPHLHARALAPGLQELVEARALLAAVAGAPLPGLRALLQEYRFEEEEGKGVEGEADAWLGWGDYALGLADATGELMRRAISAPAPAAAQATHLIRHIYTGFLGVHGFGRDLRRELQRKLEVCRASLLKAEAAVCARHMRGGADPPRAPSPCVAPLSHARSRKNNDSDDEGIY